MISAEIISRFGIPDWTRAGDYPAREDTTDRVWRWEFLRRRAAYREAWDHWSARELRSHGDLNCALTNDPNEMRQRFGVSVIYDPRKKISDHLLMQLLTPAYGFGVFHHPDGPLMKGAFLAKHLGGTFLSREAERRRKLAESHEDAGLVDYRFDASKPIGPQITKAKEYLLRRQAALHGKRNTLRPNRDSWQLFLRVLDARDCEAGWRRIGNVFWPGEDIENMKDKARRTHQEAERVRDNFPI